VKSDLIILSLFHLFCEKRHHPIGNAEQDIL